MTRWRVAAATHRLAEGRRVKAVQFQWLRRAPRRMVRSLRTPTCEDRFEGAVSAEPSGLDGADSALSPTLWLEFRISTALSRHVDEAAIIAGRHRTVETVLHPHFNYPSLPKYGGRGMTLGFSGAAHLEIRRSGSWAAMTLTERRG